MSVRKGLIGVSKAGKWRKREKKGRKREEKGGLRGCIEGIMDRNVEEVR